jgi:NodT family efflux transporter outer membrane factor (OMF) lipoprotein
MKIKDILIAAIVGMTLTGCGIYDKYESKATVPADAFGTDINTTDDSSIAQLSWREFFIDPVLQELIEQVLACNTNLNSARIAVEKSEASLKAAKLAYLPSLYFSPSGTLASFDGSPVSKTYNLPLQLSMDLDVFGSITSQKRRSQAVLMQSKLYEENVRANLISTTAQQYYMLQVLDLQLKILTSTDSLWNASLETQKAMWENGKAYSTAVNQMESSYLNVKTQIIDTHRNIRNVENAICSLLASTPQHIRRTVWGGYPLTANVTIGVPAALLQYRPDIRMADFAMAEAFYNTQAAKQAFFPSITLSGTLGWTNSSGGQELNPAKMLWNAVASLTQPIFARGKLTANKKIAQLTEEDMQKKYVQTVIDAGNQVNEALADCMASREKHDYYHRQVEVLKEAYTGTHELMDNGKASYIEVLTAQENLLSAQLNEAMNMYKGAQGVIALYIALGGGTK